MSSDVGTYGKDWIPAFAGMTKKRELRLFTRPTIIRIYETILRESKKIMESTVLLTLPFLPIGGEAEGGRMIKVGTSGFSFEDWKGEIYPVTLPQREWLPYYEKELGFDALEVNFTYYTLPSQKSLAAMSQKTSEGFEFVVKAFKGMTHEIRKEETTELFGKFKYSLIPLIEDRKLTCVLAQFPFGFFPNRENVDYLKSFKAEMESIPLVFEFRNRSWFRDQTFQFLEENRIGFCIVDEPKLARLMPYVSRATSEIGYFRFHGRNPKWFNVPISVRYNYLYKEEELKEFIPDIKDISQKTARTLVFFNNCYSGYAAKNAAEMAKLLKEKSSEFGA